MNDRADCATGMTANRTSAIHNDSLNPRKAMRCVMRKARDDGLYSQISYSIPLNQPRLLRLQRGFKWKDTAWNSDAKACASSDAGHGCV